MKKKLSNKQPNLNKKIEAELTKSKVSRRKKIIKVRAELNETETRR